MNSYDLIWILVQTILNNNEQNDEPKSLNNSKN
jgi:hypothetical protein